MKSVGLAVRVAAVRSCDELREAAQGADIRVVQLVPGEFHGSLLHANVGGLVLSAGDFGPDVRARGVMHSERLHARNTARGDRQRLPMEL